MVKINENNRLPSPQAAGYISKLLIYNGITQKFNKTIHFVKLFPLFQTGLRYFNNDALLDENTRLSGGSALVTTAPCKGLVTRREAF